MKLLTYTRQQSLVQLLLSPDAKNVQIALTILESHLEWQPALENALEVFFFMDVRRVNGAVQYEEEPVEIVFLIKMAYSEMLTNL